MRTSGDTLHYQTTMFGGDYITGIDIRLVPRYGYVNGPPLVPASFLANDVTSLVACHSQTFEARARGESDGAKKALCRRATRTRAEEHDRASEFRRVFADELLWTENDCRSTREPDALGRTCQARRAWSHRSIPRQAHGRSPKL